MNQDRLIRTQLTAMLDGGQAHMTFDDVVADFPIESINDKAPHTPYSPWHFLEHLRIAQWDILEFIRNPDHVSPDYPEGYRPRPEETAGTVQWRKSVREFRSDLNALKTIVADTGNDLFAPIPHAKEYTIFREILVIADHNAYHIGELALLRQVMGLWPRDNLYLTGSA